MKQILLLAAIITLSFSMNTFAQSTDSIIGQWYTQEGTSIVEISRCNDVYCGTIVWLKNPKDEEGKDKIDKNNPDELLRKRKIMGLKILWGFKYKNNNTWEDGKIYDPKNGKTYSCKMTLEENQLKVRGFIGFSLLGRTAVWTKKS